MKRLTRTLALPALIFVVACGGDPTGSGGGLAMGATSEIRMVPDWVDDVPRPQLFVTVSNTGSKDADAVFADVVFLQGNRVVENGFGGGERLAAGRTQEHAIYLLRYAALDEFSYDCYEIRIMASTSGSLRTYQKTFAKVCK